MEITINSNMGGDQPAHLAYHNALRPPRVPSLDWGSLHPHAHSVQFYEDTAFPLDDLTRYIGSALETGDAGIVIATRPHREELARRLESLGFDLALAAKQGRYTSLDAAAILSRIMRDGSPDTALFTELMGGVIQRALAACTGEHGRVVAFGEMVALLWGGGTTQAAIQLEHLWNDLGKTHPFDLHCAYPISSFARASDVGVVEEICATHSHVIPAETYTSLDNDQERFRAITLLQQKARVLEFEIEERKKAQETLERKERELSDFFENAALGLHWVGPDGTILRVNQAELDLLGYSHDEYIGHNIAEFHADEQTISDILNRLTCGETLHDYEARLRCKDGSVKHVLISSNVLRENGRFVHTRCFTRDITDRVQAEQALRESESRFRTMADTVPVMVWVADVHKYRIYFNRYWLDFTGRTIEQELGFGWMDDLHPDDLQRYMDLYGASFATRTEFKIEYRLRRYDGEYSWILSHGVPLFSQDGTFAGFTGSSMDITDRVQLDQRKDTFIALASHELRTPVTSLKMNTQLLKRHFERAGDLDVVRRLGKMDDQLSKLTDLVRSLLDVAKIESGKLDFTFTEFSVEDLLIDTVDDLQQLFAEHEIVLENLSTLQGAKILADRERLRQVLINLIANAVKFSPTGQRVHLGADLKDDHVTIHVQDHGIGIPRFEQDRIFERLYQVTHSGSTRAETYPGLGIGLYISAEIVKRHGGRIWVKSAVGQGSTFYFTIPLSIPPSELPEDKEATMANKITPAKRRPKAASRKQYGQS
ncbi:MAG: PAS domain S-box protein [Chloroflexota bacterium]